jgi:signal transduction histidine kinase
MGTSAISSADRGRAARRWAVDTGVAIAVVGLQLATWLAAWGHRGHGRQPVLADYLLLAVGGVALLARRRYPVAVLAVALAATAGCAVLGGSSHGHPTWLVLAAAFVNAVLYRKRVAAIASLVIGYLIAVWPPWLIGTRGNTSTTAALGLLCGLIALLSAAELIRARNQRVAAVRTRQAEEARRLAMQERLAIARDLHDVVAHNISVINVQAKTALHLMDRQPDRAREALTAIHEVSRQALGELRSVLGVLRADGADALLVPSPGLDRLDELAATARAAGIAVELEREGAPRPVPAGVDAAAYRIVQEALTNTVRHSGGGGATVRLCYDTEALTIEVDDDGRAVGSPRPGNGIAGMTERARALGGTLDAGPRPGGGFRVLARLPT